MPEPSVKPSEIGEVYGSAKQIRDPAVFEENGKIYLFGLRRTGIAAAEVKIRSSPNFRK
jgi:hypothetical protein